MNKELLREKATEGMALCNNYNFKGYTVKWEMDVNTLVKTNEICYTLACSIEKDNHYLINIINGIEFNNINDLSFVLSSNVEREDENTTLTETESQVIASLIKDIKTELNNELK